VAAAFAKDFFDEMAATTRDDTTLADIMLKLRLR
jgi:hypothetical protein